MRELTVREMRKGYAAITEALDQDGSVVLTHHGKPYAKIVPYEVEAERSAAQEAEHRQRRQVWAKQRRKALKKMPVLPAFDWDTLRADR